MFKDWDWTDTWQVLMVMAFLAALGFGAKWITSPKNVDYYYLSHGSGGNGNQASVCVYAHWTWHSDELSFCTDDQQKALDFVAKANAGMHSGK